MSANCAIEPVDGKSDLELLCSEHVRYSGGPIRRSRFVPIAHHTLRHVAPDTAYGARLGTTERPELTCGEKAKLGRAIYSVMRAITPNCDIG